MSLRQYQVLRTLSLIGPCNQTQLGKHIHISKWAIGYHIKVLKDKGLVDNQGHTFWVTVKGQGVLRNG